MQLTDNLGHKIKRTISINPDCIEILDESNNNQLESYLHFTNYVDRQIVTIQSGNVDDFQAPYAEEFGLQEKILVLKLSGESIIKYSIRVGDK
jgi:hypothetical protein